MFPKLFREKFGGQKLNKSWKSFPPEPRHQIQIDSEVGAKILYPQHTKCPISLQDRSPLLDLD